MRTVFLSTSDSSGGAAKAVYALHRAVRELGLDSRLVVSSRENKDPSVEVAQSKLLGRLGMVLGPFLEAQAVRIYPKRRNTAWWPSLIRYSFPERLPTLRQADVVILGWICGFVHPKSIGAMLSTGKRVVWRLSDMWPFTGGCHYSGGCRRYEERCGRCPLLVSRMERDLSRIVWSSKRRYWQAGEITIVSPSRWLAQCASRSCLFRKCRIEVIPTGVDTTVFKPVPRVGARSLLGLPMDKKLVLFGAADASGDERKGGNLMTRILGAFMKAGRKHETWIVAFGTSKCPSVPGLEAVAVGTVRDPRKLALLYSACDVFVAPYMEDNLPNTIIESLACGTPTVAFRVGGVPELIAHEKNGYLAAPFDTEDMARGIRFVLDSDRQTMRKRTRREAERNFSLKRCAERYISLFRELLKNRG